jgi:hypothetical protein
MILYVAIVIVVLSEIFVSRKGHEYIKPLSCTSCLSFWISTIFIIFAHDNVYELIGFPFTTYAMSIIYNNLKEKI